MMIIHADILDWAKSYDGPLFHALLCDPPYHLVETTKRFGGQNSAPAQYGTDGAFRRASRGFMGKSWDGGDIAYRPETWAALMRLLHPGAFLMAFAGSRGYHRMACAIEDAGFIIHPAIGWSFSTGFPKATRVDTQIDRRAGVERTKVGTKKQTGAKFKLTQELIDNGGFNDPSRADYDVTAPATDLAQAWQGHRYGGQALKPAFEFICVAQKPYAGRPVENITRTGAGALNIDQARIGIDEAERDTIDNRSGGQSQANHWQGPGVARDVGDRFRSNPAGRWPSNLVISHDPRCEPVGARRVRGAKGEADYTKTGAQGPVSIVTNVKTGRHYADADGYEQIAAWRCVEGCAVLALGRQSGESSSNWREDKGHLTGMFINSGQQVTGHGVADAGTAAHFFFQADFMLERLEDADAVIYEAKASRSEREAGLDPRQVRLLNAEAFDEATINDGRAKSIDNPYQRGETTRRNTHATVKPLSLCRHLATLLLPPDLYAPRRLLIPFAGVASEMIGAMLAGWEEVVGVELEADHVKIAEARLAYWSQRRHEFGDPSKPITAVLSKATEGQLDLFEDMP